MWGREKKARPVELFLGKLEDLDLEPGIRSGDTGMRDQLDLLGG